MTSSNGNILRVTDPLTGEFPSQRPATRSFGVFFDLRLNKRLSKQSRGCDMRHHRAHYVVTKGESFLWTTIQWQCGVSNHRQVDCLLNNELWPTKNQSFALLTLRGAIHRWPMDSPHKVPVMRKCFPYHELFMEVLYVKLLHLKGQVIKLCLFSYLIKLTLIGYIDNDYVGSI